MSGLRNTNVVFAEYARWVPTSRHDEFQEYKAVKAFYRVSRFAGYKEARIIANNLNMFVPSANTFSSLLSSAIY
ncbi:hypothetical protein Hypma_013435 [Hypsizygus marmoreus]|uniref:Uncharacterized protein n=1 Tax=Hypsizygus marmoreus TaxID=39966 RepID=A0A369JAZ1_HYPMA|nr:hypothetical protein Hypma_013435 [Hypsizygus marmoreus]